MRIVFPTKENMSYMSHSAQNINEAKYLTVLDIQNQNIVGVEMIKNTISSNNEEFVQTFKENQYEAIVVPQSNSLPLNELKNAGISVYTDSKSQLVLNAFNDYLNQRLALA
jgi:predicted Fe-Mo cluster-binding NifX family protein